MRDARHTAKGKTPADWTRRCVKDGQKCALFFGQKVYTLDGREAELDKLAGQKVMVKGTESGDTITVTSVGK